MGTKALDTVRRPYSPDPKKASGTAVRGKFFNKKGPKKFQGGLEKNFDRRESVKKCLAPSVTSSSLRCITGWTQSLQLCFSRCKQIAKPTRIGVRQALVCKKQLAMANHLEVAGDKKARDAAIRHSALLTEYGGSILGDTLLPSSAR